MDQAKSVRIARDSVPVDKTALNTKISEAEALTEGDYVVSTWQTLQTALTTAKNVSHSNDATQEQVNSALSGLQDAMNKLQKYIDLSDTPDKYTVAIGDTEVPSFVRNVNGTITISTGTVDASNIVTLQTAIDALNAQVPGEGGTLGVGYTGFNITLNSGAGTATSAVYFKNGTRLELTTLDGQNLIKVYSGIADKAEEKWTARVDESVQWKFVWLDAEQKVIGVTEFTTNVAKGE